MPSEATSDRHTEVAANSTAEAAERTRETAVRTTVAAQRTEASADRRTELAADRTVLATERTRPAVVRIPVYARWRALFATLAPRRQPLALAGSSCARLRSGLAAASGCGLSKPRSSRSIAGAERTASPTCPHRPPRRSRPAAAPSGSPRACRATRFVVTLKRLIFEQGACRSHGLDPPPSRHPCCRYGRLQPANGARRSGHSEGIARASRRG